MVLTPKVVLPMLMFDGNTVPRPVFFRSFVMVIPDPTVGVERQQFQLPSNRRLGEP
jgi:hypothetical protein